MAQAVGQARLHELPAGTTGVAPTSQLRVRGLSSERAGEPVAVLSASGAPGTSRLEGHIGLGGDRTSRGLVETERNDRERPARSGEPAVAGHRRDDRDASGSRSARWATQWVPCTFANRTAAALVPGSSRIGDASMNRTWKGENQTVMNNGGIAWFARNPVAANLMMIFIIVSGLIGTTTVREEVFPEVELDRISIQVPYLGAAPEEVEEGVVIRIEEAIHGVDGIKEIRSTAAEGNASVLAELELGADARRVVDEVKNHVDAITTFPLETEKPIIREMIAHNQVTDISISGQTDIFALRALAERVRDELTALPEITQVDVVSAPPYEISIEVSEVALRRHGMTFDQVADAVRRSSLDLPGRLGPHRRRRDSAAHHRAGLPRRRV